MSKFLSKRSTIALIILAISLSLGIYLETRPRLAPFRHTVHGHWHRAIFHYEDRFDI